MTQIEHDRDPGKTALTLLEPDRDSTVYLVFINFIFSFISLDILDFVWSQTSLSA
jgi:hypothetical protein